MRALHAEPLLERQRLQVLVEEAQGQVGAGLGHAVGLHVVAAEGLDDAPHQLRGDGGAAAQDQRAGSTRSLRVDAPDA